MSSTNNGSSSTNARALGNRVAVLRGAIGLSQRALAKKAGLSHAMVQSIETGRRLPSFETLDKLARVLRVTWRITLEVANHDGY